MLLNMDEKGRVYQAASHRSDGLGFEDVAMVVDQKDNTLDQAFVKADRELSKDNLELSVYNEAEKIDEENQDMINEHLKRRLRHIKEMADTIQNQPDVQNQMALEGIMESQTRSADFNQLEISGFGLSSDGVRGPSKQEKAVEKALMQSMGREPEFVQIDGVEEQIFDLDQVEQEQYKVALMSEGLNRQALERAYNEQPTQYKALTEGEPVNLPALENDLSDTKALVAREEANQYFKAMTPAKMAFLALAGFGLYKLLKK